MTTRHFYRPPVRPIPGGISRPARAIECIIAAMVAALWTWILIGG